MLDAHVDYIVLGCSHYPYLIPQLRMLLPKEVSIIDSGLAVAKQTQHILQKFNNLASIGNVEHQLYTNGNPEILEGFLSRFRENQSRIDFGSPSRNSSNEKQKISPSSTITVHYLDF